MAFSGSKDFEVTRSDIVGRALRILGVADAGETPDASEMDDAVLAFNMLVKELSTHAEIYWRQKVTLFVQPGTESYSIGPSGDHATTSFVETTLSADEALGSTTLNLTSVSGLTDGGYVGIKLDDGTIHWTTFVTAASGTITTGLASAASSGNRVYSYTTKAYRPQRIITALRQTPGGLDTELTLIGEIAYRALPDKDQQSTPTQLWYSPTLTNGTLYVWPTGDGSIDKLELITENLSDDLDAAANNPQFPIEWASCLAWLLADELAPEYDVTGAEARRIEIKASRKLEHLLDYAVENASVTFGLDNG